MRPADNHEVPTPSNRDLVHSAARAAVAAVPVVGSAAVEFFNNVFQPPIEKRRAEWMAQVHERLGRLEERGVINVEKLAQNEAFVTAALTAGNMAIRNHQREKVEALRNAVLNAALPKAPDDVTQQMFLNLVDQFTTLHLNVLAILHDPEKWFSDHGKQFAPTRGTVHERLSYALPELGDQLPLVTQVIKDLFERGLTYVQNEYEEAYESSRLKDFGVAFLKFISDPTLSG